MEGLPAGRQCRKRKLRVGGSPPWRALRHRVRAPRVRGNPGVLLCSVSTYMRGGRVGGIFLRLVGQEECDLAEWPP